MAEKKEKQVKPKKGRVKGPKLVVGDFPYVSLMPANRLNAIEVEEAKAKWIKTVGAGIAIAVVISIGAFGFKVVHQIGFDNAKQDAATVEQSILQYSEVDRALTIKSGIEGDIIAGAGNAINWSDLHNRISRNLPQGASLTTFDVVTGGKVKDANSVSVFVNVSSTQPIDYAQILNSFGTVQGILPESLLIGDLTATGTEDATPIYSYPVAFTVDNTVMSQRWSYLTNPDAEAAKTQDSASEQDAAAPSAENSTETPEVTTEENE